jgi:hypothetical protein
MDAGGIAMAGVEGHIRDIIERLELDLSGVEVLTEAGSGNYLYTPVIASLAGAARVRTWIRDTSFGSAADIASSLEAFHRCPRIDIAQNERPLDHIRRTDLVTNLGHVRPLDREFIDHLKPGAVISYMCEAWEVREGDIDLERCRERGIPVHGVWENHPDLLIFERCGDLALRMCDEAGIGVAGLRVLIISADPFGDVIQRRMIAAGAARVDLADPSKLEDTDVGAQDLIFLADYRSGLPLFSPNGPFSRSALNRSHLVHLAGDLDLQYCLRSGATVFPSVNGFSHRMTFTLAHLGAETVIDLHAAGLKVGENMLRGTLSPLNQPIV